ncbi:xanthine dehydrogenase family protein subunit M [Candidatus Bathyarchaeota archaeon]|nr:xanthine dehydrogenase family protein subunit M [Candidatus Bathyarchaeota archaeon]
MSINKHNTHILHNFKYFTPSNIQEACKLLSELPEDTKILAGGTDLIPKMKESVLRPSNIINIKQITGLTNIEEKNNRITIGALTKIRDIEKNSIIYDKANILHQATRVIGSVQIRNLATIGGNLCNASPAADSAAALIALNADTKIVGLRKERIVNLEKFFKGPSKSILEKDEILTHIQFQIPNNNNFSYYRKIGRVSLDLATVSLAVQAEVIHGKILKLSMVAGSVAPIPIRLVSCEESLLDKKLNNDLIQEIAVKASKEIKPITDARGSASYRKNAIKGLTKEAFNILLEKTETEK